MAITIKLCGGVGIYLKKVFIVHGDPKQSKGIAKKRKIAPYKDLYPEKERSSAFISKEIQIS